VVAVVACDDGRVEKLGGGFTVLACILWDGRPLDVELGLLRVDGLEASSVVAYLTASLALRSSLPIRALLLDSLTIAGFNVVSPATVMRLAGVPVVVVYKYKPSSSRLEGALRKHFRDWSLRMRVLKLVDEAVEVNTRRGPLYIIPWGVSVEEARRVVEETQVYARTPEPLRIADMIASEVTLHLSSLYGWRA